MSKKSMIFCILLMLMIITSACGTDTSMVEEIADKNDDSTAESISETENDLPNDEKTKETDAKETETNEDNKFVDIDLTALSSTMVYSEVYNMMVNPDDYMGKTIKVSGIYNAAYFEDTEKYYHFVVISDATACCQSGIEFIWDDNSHVFPDEYPENNTIIEIVGVFDSYEELGETYYYMKTNDLIIK